MKSPIIFCFLLAYTACAQSGHFHDERFLEKEDERALNNEAMKAEEFPGSCFICKRIMEKVQRTINDGDSKKTIERKLHNACNKLGRLSKRCQGLVSKYINKLENELATTDDARKACVKIHLCKPKALWD